MTIKGLQAWVTSAVDAKSVTKALVLAASLRRVVTSKKVIVITTLAVPKDLRENLKAAFDLVVLLDQDTPNGLNLEDYAKIQGFSLLPFSKCVYLAPESLVLKNCDDIFWKYGPFAICDDEEGNVDTSVYIFTPSSRLCTALETTVHHVDAADGRVGDNFFKYFKKWMQEFVPNSERLGKKYNFRIRLKHNIAEKCLDYEPTILTFSDGHPLDYPYTEGIRLTSGMAVAKHAVDMCWHMYETELAKGSIDFELAINHSPQHRYETEPIAIVGLDFRLPGGNNPDEFWDLLANGREGIITLPSFRWTKENIYFPCKNRQVQAGFLNFPIDDFDGKFFGVSPKDAIYLDPQQRLLHEVTWCALEDAGIDPLTLRATKTGIFVGSWIHDYRESVAHSPDVEFFRGYMGNSIAATAARLSHFLGTTGPSIATESGCSSGIVAVDMGIKSLRNYDSNLAIAGGVNLLLHPFDQESIGFVLSPDGRCKTFDAKADGFGRAEGCAVLLMKRLSDAVRDGNKIWGLIRGSAVTQEGLSKSMGTPTVQCESLAMEWALEDAGVEPEDVSYVETHGTGTPVGDPLEIASIAKAYSKGRRDPLMIGSVKTNVGHTESVSGITGIIKVLLSMKHETIPPHLNFETLNPNINLDIIPGKIPLEPVPWPKVNGKQRLAGVSSFGISGTDGHIIIEEAPQIHKSVIDHKLERPLHIMKISAKSQESFDKLLENYGRMFLEKADSKDVEFSDIAHSANTGRSTFNHRAVIIAKDCSQAAEIIKAKSFMQADIPTQSSPICFLFTGQGSQYPNMASSLYTTSPVFRSHFNECAEVLQTRYNIPIKQVLWENSDELSRTLYSQTSIFCVEYCLLKLWESWGVKPDFVLGHSLGEFAAAVAAGALGFEDALMLVAERSRLIDNLPRGKMLVLRADKKTVDQHIAKYKEIQPEFWADYAALNSPDQTVIAGDSHMIENFAKFCEEKSLKALVLAATHAFHSRHMNPMLEEYRKVASSVIVKKVREDAPKYISGMEGKFVEVNEIDADYWVRHTREKVSFIDACKAIKSEVCTLFLEIGPHPILSALVMMNTEGVSVKCLPSLRRKEDEWVTLLDSLSKLYLSDWKGKIDWQGFDRYHPRQRVSLPFYPFNRKPAWVQFTRLTQELHPLLGKIAPNASNQFIFERRMTVKNTNFAQDHMIGNHIVFPGAGFLELALSGGYASVQGLTEEWTMPRRAIGVRNLKIIAPLAMHDSNSTIIQTVVSLDEKAEEDLSYSVSTYRNTDPNNPSEGQWILHSTATFLPVTSMKADQFPVIDIPLIKDSWEMTENKESYEELLEVGLRFGSKFQSLQFAWKSEQGLLTQVKVPDDFGAYLIHPVVGDAMLQTIMMWMHRESEVKKKLQVPVRFGEVTWLSNSDSQARYIYCSNTETGPYAVLLDDEAIPLAYMADVDFAETTAKLIEGMIQQQSSALPLMWEEVWRSTRGPLQNRLLLDDIQYPTHLSEEEEERLRQLNDFGDDERKFCSQLADITHLFFLEALCKLGWTPELNIEFTLDGLLATLSIQSRHKMYVRYYLRTLAIKGAVFEMLTEDGTRFRCTSLPPKLEAIVESRQRLVNVIDRSRVEYILVVELGQFLHEILTGETDPLGILFTEDPSKVCLRDVYYYIGDRIGAATYPTLSCLIGDTVMKSVDEQREREKMEPVLRVLEVGAGTGKFTYNYLKHLAERKVALEYFYTDISPAFFAAAEKELGELTKYVVFKKFDMEQDPFEQGLGPQYFDVILEAEVIHISKDIEKTLRNLRPLLKPGGVIQIVETVGEDPSIFGWGLLEGYWRYEDHHIRPFHASLTVETWVEVLRASGFPRVEWRPAYNSSRATIIGYTSIEHNHHVPEQLRQVPKHAWLIFDDGTELTNQLGAKLSRINREVVTFSRPKELTEGLFTEELKSVLDHICERGLHLEGILYLWGLREDRDQAQISLPLLTICQLVLASEKCFPRLYAVTQGLYEIGDSEVLNPSAGSFQGLLGSAYNEENGRFLCTIMDLAPNLPVSRQVEELFQNLWYDQMNIVAFRDGKRLVPKLTSFRITNESLKLPSGCSRFQLQLPKTKSIADLEFTFLDHYDLEDNEIEIQVKAYALNFRDVFAVLKPIAVFEDINAVGLDFAGVVSRVGACVQKRKVGDRVVAMNTNKYLALPSHVKLEDKLAVPLPDQMSFGEGSTLPAVFLTAYYCLIRVAKMSPVETVLIHTGSGGVGLCAIQVAQQIGATIISTAGSHRKRNYLRNLGIQHVFHSRTTEFSKQVLEVTNGRGVDIVLNSLTGPGFKEASLECLAEGGRFIEMSKLNVWKEEEVQLLRPDVVYWILDLAGITKREFEELTQELENVVDKSIKGIPYDRFDALDIRRALNYLQKAKHIGKVVCIMPEVKMDKSKLVTTTQLFNEESTYLITGGLGGIGFAVAKWMLNNGAKHLALLSRNPPRGETVAQIESWNNNGKHVKNFSVDIGEYEQIETLFMEIELPTSGFPPLRGVMHAAGVLQNATVQNQSWSKFQQTFNAKVNGTWNLHDLTKDLQLEHFVLFSSVSANFGGPGQSNHSSSNSFEDALAHYRTSIGLPATSVNWANWGEVGVATEIDFPGVRPISTTQGLTALETVLKTQVTHVAVANIDSFALLVTVFPKLKSYVDDKRLFGDIKSDIILNKDEFWAKVDSAECREDKLEVFKNFIKITVRTLLKMDATEGINDNEEFQSLGIDSLMMLEMKNGMQNVLGERMTLTVSQLKDCTTTYLLANKLVDILEGEDDKRNLPTQEELQILIREDSKLPGHIVPHSGNTCESIDPLKIRNVLLTGVTGTLGSYFLRDLCKREHIDKVYCLIRKSGKDISVSDRLHSRLQKISLLEEVNMDKVECIQGDITGTLLDLDEQLYDELAENVDAIIHCAARVDHNSKYWKAPEAYRSHMRTTNVLGTIKTLEFAVHKKLKHVYYASALIMATTVDEHGLLSEDWEDVGTFDEFTTNVGYPISKHICEQLVRQAVERGIPCKTFRLPFVGGDSRTGRTEIESNHFLLRSLGMMKLGCMQDMPAPIPIIPVDKCVEISLQAFFDRRTIPDVYHVCQRNPDVDQVLMEIAKDFGIEMEAVPYVDFVQKLKAVEDTSPLAPFAKLYLEQEVIDNATTPSIKHCRMYLENPAGFLTNTKMSELYKGFDENLEPSIDVLRRDLHYLEKSGVFKKFGIASSL